MSSSNCECQATTKCSSGCVRNRCEMTPPFIDRVCNCIQVVEQTTGEDTVYALRISMTTTIYNCNKQKCLKHVTILDDLGNLSQGIRSQDNNNETPCQSCATDFCVLGDKNGLTTIPAEFTGNYTNGCLDKNQVGQSISKEKPQFNTNYLKGQSNVVFSSNTGIGGNGIPLEPGQLLQWTEMITVPCSTIEFCTTLVVAGEGFCPITKSTTMSLAGLCPTNDPSDISLPSISTPESPVIPTPEPPTTPTPEPPKTPTPSSPKNQTPPQSPTNPN